MSSSQVLVVGTVALDILFPFDGDIRNEIPLKGGKLRSVNMSFLAKKSQYYYGGTAGNIAYGLGLQGVKPIMFSSVGIDFKEDFQKHLEKHDVVCKPIIGPKGSETAKCFQLSDNLHQQITIFQANHYGDRVDDMSLLETITKEELAKIKVAIFSPGNNVSTLQNTIEFRRYNEDATVIFDPGMNVTSFSKEDLAECASHSNILISNDIEILRIEQVHGYSIKDLLDIGLDYVVETQGGEGSTIHAKNSKTSAKGGPASGWKIRASKPRKVVETTGAGDAYRAGMIAGLIEGDDIKAACKRGAEVGAKCVEEYGGQGYKL